MTFNLPFIILITLLILAVFFIFNMRQTVKKNLTFLTEVDFTNGMRKGQLVDIRKKADFDAGHINGARHFPLGLLAKSTNKLRTDQPIYLVCENGKKSKRATIALVAKNFSKIYALEGGMNAWSKPLKVKK